MQKRRLAEQTALALLVAATLLVILLAVFIFAYITINGATALSSQFLSKPPDPCVQAGGIMPAIVGTFLLMLGTAIFALPIGTFAGIYLAEYSPDNWLTRLINLAVLNLAGVPSIVFGLFGLGLFVTILHFGLSLISASLTLASQALAMTITTSREAILSVPAEYREGSLALGATRWQTIRHIVLPRARPGILTGAVLALSRAAGETAPIMLVGAAFFAPRLPSSPLDPFMALPYHLYAAAQYLPEISSSITWGTALVLLMVVLSFNLVAVLIRHHARAERAT